MAVPEAAVNENRFPATREDDVGRPGQRSIVQPVTVPGRVKETPDVHLRRRALAPNCLHVGASGFRGQSIHADTVSAFLQAVP